LKKVANEGLLSKNEDAFVSSLTDQLLDFGSKYNESMARVFFNKMKAHIHLKNFRNNSFNIALTINCNVAI
jgi:hypothetical protein